MPQEPVVVRDSLRGQLQGSLCYPGEPEYEQARTTWNAMIDERPAAIVRAAAAGDVARAIDVARERDLVPSVRGVGHNIAETTCATALQ